MTANPTPIDISNMPELMRLAEEVARTKKPRELKRDRETVAILVPAITRQTRTKTKTDYAAFRSAAGGWNEVDTDQLMTDIYTDRRRSNSRPPIAL